MGNLEKASRKRQRRKNLQKIILGVVGTAGLLAFAAIAPNAVQMLSKLGIINPKQGYRETGNINRARKRLIEVGLLSHDEKGFLRLTAKGEAKLRHLELTEYKTKKPRRWDHKWRMLVFDIPEYRKNLRDKIRTTLLSIGFIRLQDSVWVYPYDCEDLVALLKADFRVGKDLLYLIVDSIENDVAIKKRFGIA